MYESKKERLLTRAQFVRRVLLHVSLALGSAAAALVTGVLGYHYIAELPWIDALLNASMILGGMGPVDPLRSDGAKIFASLYALFSGLLFIGVLAVIVVPFVHRMMHRLHIDEEGS